MRLLFFYHIKMWFGFALSFILYAFSVVIAPEYRKMDAPYIPPPHSIQYLTAGFRVQMADSLWLRAVQDFDYCSKQVKDNECVGKSWLFMVLDLASVLDSRLEPVMYQTGGLALTVIISDYAGASAFFDKGVRVYPNDWYLNYSAAYHALYEEKNKVKASRLYLRAVENGGPSWLRQLAARLSEEGGDSEFAEKIIRDMISLNVEKAIVDRLRAKLDKIRANK